MRLASLSSKERLVLSRLAGAEGSSCKDIARSCRTSEHSVRRLANKALSAGWLRPTCFINHPALGLQTFNLFFSCPRERHTAVVKFLQADPRVVWATENVGHPRYQVTVVSRTAAEITALFDDIARRCKAPISSRYWSLEVSLEYWGTRMLTRSPSQSHFTLSPQDAKTYDLLDLRIIDALRTNEVRSVATMTRILKESSSTISYRLKRLREQNIISPVFHRLNSQKAGAFTCEYLLTLARVEGDIHRDLIDFCNSTPEVTMLVRTFGNWDYKLVVEAENFDTLLDTRDLLEAELPATLTDVTFVITKNVISEQCKLAHHPDTVRTCGKITATSSRSH